MGTEYKNPWEGINCELIAETYGEPQDMFNNIKLNDFPFLKSHYPFVDYLIKCGVCDVILLPESAKSHYEDRHSHPPESDKVTGSLPYQALSLQHESVESGTKRERTNGTKRLKVSAKRSKRDTRLVSRELSTLEAISETDSLSSFTDDNSKRVSSNVSEEENERLREPVLLKLAKSDCHMVQSVACKVVPKLPEDSSSSQTDRSVWSVICSTEHGSTGINQSSKSRMLSLNDEHSTTGNALDSSSICTQSDSGLESNSLPAVRPSSYPSTPALSPHVPSPSASNASDDVIFAGSGQRLRMDQVRCVSRSSTHSSSSSGFDGFSDTTSQPAANKKKYPHRTPVLENTVDQAFMGSNRLKRSQSVLSEPFVLSGSPGNRPAFVLRGSDTTNYDIPPSSDYAGDRNVETTTSRLNVNLKQGVSLKSEGWSGRNGFHTRFRGTYLSAATTSNRLETTSLPDTLHRKKYLASHILNRHRVGDTDGGGTPEIIQTNAPSPAQLEPANVKDSILLRQANRVSHPFDASKCANRSPRVGSSRMFEPTTCSSRMTDDINAPIDPLIHCGCMQHDGLRCRNSLQCPIHTADEKRRVSRSRDLRSLMREAREQAHLSRQSQVALPHGPTHTNNADLEIPQNVIDLTEEFMGSSSESTQSMSVVGPEYDKLRLRLLSQMSPAQRMMYQNMPRAQSSHNSTNRSRGVSDGTSQFAGGSSHVTNRITRRPPANREVPLAMYNPSVSYLNNMLEEPMSAPYTNSLTVEEHNAMALRRNTWFAHDPYLVDSGTAMIGEGSVGQIPGRFLPVPKRSSPSFEFSSMMNRKSQQIHPQPQRRQQQQPPPPQRIQRSQYASIDTLGSLGCDPTILGSSSSLMTDPVDVNGGAMLGSVDDSLLMGSQSVPTELLQGSSHMFDGRQSLPDAAQYVHQTFRGPSMDSGGLSSGMSSTAFDSRTLAEGQMLPFMTQNVGTNQFTRPVYGATQVVREPHGRVIVDDMREKSITGRSRKTAKSTFRHNPPVYPTVTYPTMLPSRYQAQSNVAFISSSAAGIRKQSPIGLVPNRSAMLPRSMITGTVSDGNRFISQLVPDNSNNTGMTHEATLRPAFMPHTMLRPGSHLSSANGPCLGLNDPVSSFNPLPSSYGMPMNEALMESDAIDLDGCIEAASASTAFLGTRPSEPSMMGSIDPNNPDPMASGSLGMANRSPTITDHSGMGWCKNRLFLIRPNTIKRSPGLVLRAKRNDSPATANPAGCSSLPPNGPPL